MDNGTLVNVVVPYGPNRGEVTATGTIESRKHSGMDGTTYMVRELTGELVEHAELWLKPV